MLVPFDQLPDSSRVWIYQSPRFLSDEESLALETAANTFAGTWEAHHQPLKAAAKMFYNSILVFAIDEGYNPVSGCGIDKSVDFARQASQQYHTDFFDRMSVAVLQEDSVALFKLNELKAGIREGKLQPTTGYLDNLVPDLGSLRSHWVKPMGQGWMKRYFETELI